MAPEKMEVLLEDGGFDTDGSVGTTMTHEHIDVQKHDFGGGNVPSKFDGIEVLKELGEGVGTTD